MNGINVDTYVYILDTFFKEAVDDPRITATHISLYVALLHLWSQYHFINPMAIERDRVMHLAKISSTVTYFRSIKSLHEFGYINYSPAGHRHMKSVVYIPLVGPSH